MLSIELIRRDPDLVRKALDSRGEKDQVDQILAIDVQRRQAVAQGDELRSRRNQVSRQVGQAKAGGQEPPAETIQEMGEVGDEISRLEQEVKDLDKQLSGILLTLPNIPLTDVPLGLDESANTVIRQWGEHRVFDFTPIPHWDLGEQLGIIDFEKGVKLSGSRFYTMFGAGAKLERSASAPPTDRRL